MNTEIEKIKEQIEELDERIAPLKEEIVVLALDIHCRENTLRSSLENLKSLQHWQSGLRMALAEREAIHTIRPIRRDSTSDGLEECLYANAEKFALHRYIGQELSLVRDFETYDEALTFAKTNALTMEEQFRVTDKLARAGDGIIGRGGKERMLALQNAQNDPQRFVLGFDRDADEEAPFHIDPNDPA